MKLILVGMNHRSAPIAVRERLAVQDVVPPLQKLVAADEIDEAVLISTCNRVEVVALTRNLEAARHRLRSFFHRDLDRDGGAADGDLSAHLYEFTASEAMRHVLRVASALDSMVVGEPQILGQMKDSFRSAVECNACGPILTRLFQHAFTTAKRVRTETRVGERPVSVARVAVDLARQIFENLEEKRAVMIGAGEMIEAALTALRGAGLASVAVANRTPERAADLAVRFEGTAHGMDELAHLLSDADVVLSCIGGDRPILTPELMRASRQKRRHLPIFVIDIGVPRNADPAIDRLDNVYLYDIDDLGSVANENHEHRCRETARAEALVTEEQQRFDGWFAALRAVPTIKHLRNHVENIRAREFAKAVAKLDLAGPDRERIEALTRSIANKILHAPLARLRREAEREEGIVYLESARMLFGLDDDDAAAEAEGTDDTDDTAESE